MKRKLTRKEQEVQRVHKENAAAWGNSVAFWIRHGDVKQAGRRARLAARWALKALEGRGR